ncbi:MAG: peptidoglycan DD-metalloendopeptidase family protein [Bacteroidetes bacterium]|nr:peptidoglycan DD-metalloendopeptidase family protein [Bacteroidota bacterium]
MIRGVQAVFWAGCVVWLGIASGCGEGQGPHGSATGGAFRAVAEPEPTMRFGVVWDDLLVDSGEVKSGQSLSHILDPAGIGPGRIANLAANSRKTWDVRSMRAGHRWWLASETVRDSAEAEARVVPKWFIYERNPKDYALFSLGDTLGVRLGSYPVDTVYARAQGAIVNSLYMDFEMAGHPTNLAVAMANVYAWTIDFSRLQKDDTYDVLYRREMVHGTPVGMPEVLSSTFTHWNRPLESYRFEHEGDAGYYDLEGGSLQKVFLKAPVEFSRISSRYNPKRFHPVLNKVKGHYGTDYAAPTGTPIVAVGDGVVTKSSYTSGNGKYVKIRHNSTYETQYLHMSERAVKEGQRVTQGQTIGYVGQTGLATGPHVCFRFWKNGQQVDHLREEFPPSDPIAADLQQAFADEVARLEALKSSVEPNVAPVKKSALR